MVNLKSRRVLGAIGATVGLVLVVTGLVYSGVIPVGPTLSCIGVSGSTRTFTLIASLGGFNDSKTQASDGGFGVWPVMNVSKCDHVTIRLVNADSQTHSVVVRVLAMEPLLAPSGQILALNFLAYKTGHFLVQCTVTACTVHEYMQNAQLNVA